MRVPIDVTRRDIKLGACRDAQACPVARAIRRRLVPKAHVYVGQHNVRVGLMVITDRAVALPRPARDLILAFDKGDPVGPVSFTLNVPAWLARRKR